MEFETVIGLEIHAQLKTNTKIFCGCKNKFGQEPNAHGCPVCLGLPGSLPVLNRKVVDMAVLAGVATDCIIAEKSIFSRKNYFYPDLTKGYQISQFDKPICEHGKLEIIVDGKKKVIGITRIHLEEDAGKLIHDIDVDSLFDVNRCGTPLIEIVSEPDMRSPKEAHAYLSGIKQILEYIEVCDCNMEEGSLRCDANISIRPMGQTTLGTRTELKNMNSFRNVERALEYEIYRQREVIESGGHIIQQTFLWDANKNITISMRTKEDAHDYRYFPEPDLMPLIVDPAWIEKTRNGMVELPTPRTNRFIDKFKLSQEHAQVLTVSRMVADYFEEALLHCKRPQIVANWVMGEILRISKDKKTEVNSLVVTPKRLGDLLNLLSDNTISASAAKKVLYAITDEDRDPAELIDKLGLKQISNVSELEDVIKKIIADNSDAVEKYKGGDKKLTGFFVGQAMKATKGKGNPKEINRLLASLIG